MAFIVFTLQSNFLLRGFIRSSKLTLCEYPARCNFLRNRSTRSLSAALAQPHHAGAAYRRRAQTADRGRIAYTVNSALSCNPFALRMRSAYVEEAHLLMISSTWDVTDRSLVNRTPRIFSLETLSIPSGGGSGTVQNCPSSTFGTSISLDLSVLSFRLFYYANLVE